MRPCHFGKGFFHHDAKMTQSLYIPKQYNYLHITHVNKTQDVFFIHIFFLIESSRLGNICNQILLYEYRYTCKYKTSLRAHTESELDMLGVLGKLVKYVVHPSKRKRKEKKLIKKFFTQVAQTAIDHFWSQGILRVKNVLLFFSCGSELLVRTNRMIPSHFLSPCVVNPRMIHEKTKMACRIYP